MTCTCIETIEAGLPEHKLDIAIVWRREPSALLARTFTALTRRDNGRREARSSKPRMVAHKFCPFCGVEHDPRASERTEAYD